MLTHDSRTVNIPRRHIVDGTKPFSCFTGSFDVRD